MTAETALQFDGWTVNPVSGEIARAGSGSRLPRLETRARAVGEHSILLGWMRLDPRLDALRGRQCFADVEKRVYPPESN